MPPLTVVGAVREAGNSLPTACALLWHLDRNRLEPQEHYELDIQRRSNRHSGANRSRPLFKYFSRSVWERPTFRTFKSLLLRFDPRAISLDTFDEEHQFLSAICRTDCIRFAYQWLTLRGCIRAGDMRSFQEVLRKLWFTNHAVTCQRATGFEHVFCGEINRRRGRDRLNGLHNYVRVYLEEQYGNLKYLGYVAGKGDRELSTRSNKRNRPVADNDEARCNAGADQTRPLVTIHFLLHGHEKHVSSMFCGVSPEFEFALYTMVGLSNFGNIVVRYGDCRTNIRVILRDGKILTAYPCVLNIISDGFEGQRRFGSREFGIIDLTDENASEERPAKEVTREVEVVDLTEEDDLGQCPSDAGEGKGAPGVEIMWKSTKRLKRGVMMQTPKQSIGESANGRVGEIHDSGVEERLKGRRDVIEIDDDGIKMQHGTRRETVSHQKFSAVKIQRCERPCPPEDTIAIDEEQYGALCSEPVKNSALMRDHDKCVAPNSEMRSVSASQSGVKRAYEVPDGMVCIDDHQHVLVTEEEAAFEELGSDREETPVTEIESYDIDPHRATVGNRAGSATNGRGCLRNG